MTLSKTFFKALEIVEPPKTPLVKQDPFPVRTPSGEIDIVDPVKEKTIVTVSIREADKKIDLFFSEIPSREVRLELKKHGFWYRPTDHGWEHKDDTITRLFLNEYFKTELEFNQSPKDALESNNQSQPIPSYTPTSENKPEAIEETPSPELAHYRSQVDDLIDYLKCPPADLLLMAIDAYHKQIFSRPN